MPRAKKKKKPAASVDEQVQCPICMEPVWTGKDEMNLNLHLDYECTGPARADEDVAEEVEVMRSHLTDEVLLSSSDD